MLIINLPDLPDGYEIIYVSVTDKINHQGIVLAKSEHNYVTWFYNPRGYCSGNYFSKAYEDNYDTFNKALKDYHRRIDKEIGI